jgi:3-deoxy-D-manno-octulosonate 8-phosphate phosphatase (KDO 8-P phosphatase)
MAEVDFANIDLLVLDVDGVLTDGRIFLTSDGDEIKVFHARDGAGMKYWKRAGRRLAIISGRGSPAVTKRAKALEVDAIRLNVKDKLPVFEEVLAEMDVPASRVAVVGDDLVDVPMLRNCGFAITVPDAPEEVRQVAQYVTQREGGFGAVREVVEMILKGAGLWDQILSRYFPGSEG